VSSEEIERMVDEMNYPLLVFALIESVNDDEERSIKKDKSPFHTSLKRFVNQPLELHGQGNALCEQAWLSVRGSLDERGGGRHRSHHLSCQC
jgi:hypothetical protein